MKEIQVPITEASRLRASYAEIKYWERQGVDLSLLEPVVGSVALGQVVRLTESIEVVNIS